MHHAVKIAAFICASCALGSLVALTVPTQITNARNPAFERLSEPKPVFYPGQDRVIAGQDSYAVTYSPQWLAVAEKAERARRSEWLPPRLAPVGYDQPSPEQDFAAETDPETYDEHLTDYERADEAAPGG